LIERIQETALLRTSAMVGRFFQIDPLTVANGDSYDYAFRLAAYYYASEVEREEAAKRKAEQDVKAAAGKH